jgi:hypothetical protein
VVRSTSPEASGHQGPGHFAGLEVVVDLSFDLGPQHVQDLLAHRRFLHARLVGEVDPCAVDTEDLEPGVRPPHRRRDHESLDARADLVVRLVMHVEQVQQEQVVLLLVDRLPHPVAVEDLADRVTSGLLGPVPAVPDIELSHDPIPLPAAAPPP